MPLPRVAWENKMRVIVVVVASLTALGLAAFGVVATQRAAGRASLFALAAQHCRCAAVDGIRRQ
jgi:hypothetical protein